MSSEEVELLSDSKYRQFIAAVEKALRSFESTSEWADLISALGKLNKVLQSYSKFTIIPRKLMIGKRLSQCMHPALPSGVHLKALETYTLIFERIGQKRLSQDLFIYSAGLFPLMSHSAMSVKPILMTVYEDHFLPLGAALIPSLPGLLLALLPGIEEGSDYIERTISLLESFSSCTDKDIFFDALWQSLITSPTARLPATIFLLSQLDRHLSLTEQKHLLGKNYSFMVQGVCLTLNDQLALVQRNVLDFSVQLLPLNSTLLDQHDLSTIMCAALGVLLRRDMSLNRRLYQWMLGANGEASALGDSLTEDDTTQYFETHSKPLVVEGLRCLFRQHVGASVDALKSGTKLEILKPYRILLNLLDKPEIGSAILEDTLVDVFQNLFDNSTFFRHPEKNCGKESGSTVYDRNQKNSRKEDALKENAMEELIKTANLLFNTFEPYFMWQYIAKLLAQCNANNENGVGECDGVCKQQRQDGLKMIDVIRLTDFILNIVALEASVETESKHWPELLAHIIQELTKGCQYLSLEELEGGIHLCSKLLSKVTPSTNVVLDTHTAGVSHQHHPDPTVFGSIEDSLDGTIGLDDTGVLGGGVRSGSSSSGDTYGSQTSSEKCEVNDDDAGAQEDGGTVGDDGVPTTDSGKQGDEDADVEEGRADNEKNSKREDGGKVKKSESLTKTGEAEKKSEVDGKKRSGDGRRKNKSTDQRKKSPHESGKSLDVEDKRERRKERDESGKRRKERNDKVKKVDDANVSSQDSGGTRDIIAIHGVKGDDVDVGQSALIRDSIKDYEKFILEFFRHKILHSEKWSDCLEDEQGSLVFGKGRRSGASEIVGGGGGAGVCQSESAETYSATCKLLVELSCFPMHSKGSERDGTTKLQKDKAKLPPWLRCLITCCCEVEDFDIQSTSVATLLDLINLTLSVSPDNSGGRVGGTVIPILTYAEVMIIEKSDIYQVIANNLWSILGRPVTIHHRKAVELLIQLHNLTPSPHLCENVIGSSMVSDCKESRLEALKRFANLWHIAKSILAQSVGRTARGLRTFDRSLFVMLDGLESDEPEIRSLTKMWLSHSLEQGDIGRILEPLMLLLLHPSTARVSYYYRHKKSKKPSVSNKTGKKYEKNKSGEDELEIDGGNEGDVEQEESKKTGKTDAATSNTKPQGATTSHRTPDMHKLHYCGKCDYQRILYAFRTLSSILRVVPRQFVCAAAATSIGSSSGPYEERIRELLIRHKRSLLGTGFYGPLYGGNTAVSSDANTPVKLIIKPNTSKYLEILITIALYFIRSHYLPASKVEPDFIEGNIKTQVVSLECLSNLTWELVKLVRESGHGFGNFITDLLSRCKVQKAIAHCLVSTTKTGDLRTGNDSTQTIADISRTSSEVSSDISRRFLEETVDEMILQSKLLEVVESLIVLEHVLVSCFEALTPDHLGNTDFEIIMKGDEVAPQGPQADSKSPRFVQGKSLSSQEMLLNMVLCSLEPKRGFDMSSRWTGFVIECLPYFGTDLKRWVVPVVLQMCCNLADVATLFKGRNVRSRNKACLVLTHKQFPPDHLLAVLAGLTSICHFCLLEAVSSPVLVIQARGDRAGITTGDSNPKNVRSTQIFANLLHAFSSNNKANDSPSSVENPTPLLEAREGLLSALPRVISTLLALWGTWDLDEPLGTLPSSMALLGTAKALRQSILQLLTPIAMTHTIVFLAAIADVWNKNKVTEKDIDLKPNGYLAVSDEQLMVISLVLDIKALSLEVVIDTVRQILRQELSNRDKGFEASLLHFSHEFLHRSTAAHMTQAKGAFLTLLKEGLQLNLPPPAVFLLLVNLHSYYVKTPAKDDRKSRKESQDVSQRLIEACTSIAGLSLGSSAWFSGKLSVIAVPDAPAVDATTEPEDDPAKVEVRPEPPKKPVPSTSGNTSKHSTQALVVLADVLASLLDMVFGREEKERVVNFLINVMGNVTPYLRNHSYPNVRSFRACSALVASLSGYQYTRKAWRKDMFDLFFETAFFQMDKECIGNWRTIIDNLFAQDPLCFRELMARATVTSSPAISFFANHEQEMQQRALMVKRLSFTVFSSEPDQYQSLLPEMQERLAECLRMPQVPVLHEQVFLFFRVLLVRMSDNMTSIWPMIISEMIHVFLLMESDLLQTDTPTRDQQMFYSEAVLGASGYVNYSQEKWLGLYLAVCKLLDMALCLPSEQLPQFQMYRWAFEGSHERPAGESGPGSVFTPYVSRIAKLLAKRKNVYVTDKSLECHAGKPLLTMYQLESVDELLPFLRLLSSDSRLIHDMRNSEKQKTRKFKSSASRSLIERLIERDFLEPLVE